jgi:hypothetical protein
MDRRNKDAKRESMKNNTTMPVEIVLNIIRTYNRESILKLT